MNLRRFDAIKVNKFEWIEVQEFLFSIGYRWQSSKIDREIIYFELQYQGDGYILLKHDGRCFTWVTDNQFDKRSEEYNNIVNMKLLSRVLKLEKIGGSCLS